MQWGQKPALSCFSPLYLNCVHRTGGAGWSPVLSRERPHGGHGQMVFIGLLAQRIEQRTGGDLVFSTREVMFLGTPRNNWGGYEGWWAEDLLFEEGPKCLWVNQGTFTWDTKVCLPLCLSCILCPSPSLAFSQFDIVTGSQAHWFVGDICQQEVGKDWSFALSGNRTVLSVGSKFY